MVLARIIIAWAILAVMPLGSFASHLIGGEISYACLGGDEYEITLTIYRDCFSTGAAFDDLATVTIYDDAKAIVENLQIPFPGSSPVPLTLNNPCLGFPPTLCIEKATYRTTIVLPEQAGGYTLVHQRCCRSPNLINVTTPENFGSTYTVHIPGPEVVTCNSTPVFNEIPQLAACVGVELDFDLSATDPDGDLLEYSLCDPYHGGGRDTANGTSFNGPKPDPGAPPPFSFVPWGAGYSTQNQMDCNPALSIDQNGIVSGIPTQQGKYLFSVCVNEIRDGVVLGTSRRDYMITVVACDLPVQADFLEQNDSSRCSGLTYEFTNMSNNGKTYLWDFGDPSTVHDTSSLEHPIYTYPDTGTYPITLIVNPGEPCEDEKIVPFKFYHKVRSKVEPVEDQCFDGHVYRFEGSGEYREGDATIVWDFGEFASVQQVTDTLTVDNISYSKPGTFSAALTISEKHCSYADTVQFTLFPKIKADFNFSEHEGCPPLTVNFNDSSFAWQNLSYRWTFGDGSTSGRANPEYRYEESGVYSVQLIIESDEGDCAEADTILKPFAVTVHPEPVAGFSVDPVEASVFHPTWSFTDEAEGHENCGYSFGDGTYAAECNPIHEFVEGGDYPVYQMVKNRYGCRDTALVMVRVNPEFVFFIPNAFTPNGDTRNELYRPEMMSVDNYEFEIFDRWGHRLFKTHDPNAGWDGIPQGGNKIAQDGVYVYQIKGWDTANNQAFQRIGHFTLLGGDR